MTVLLLRPGEPLRAEAEALARRMFRLRYGAEISHLPRRLLATLGHGGRPVAVAGLRDAADGFFSECYLDAPAEVVVGAAVRRPVRREELLEITALAAEPASALPIALLRAALSTGHEAGCAWGLFTATRGVRAMARRLGVPLLELAPARRDRAPDPASWGDYYEQDPRVCAVDIAIVAPLLAPPTVRGAVAGAS